MARERGAHLLVLFAALAVAPGCSDKSNPTGDGGPDRTRYRITVDGSGYGSLGEKNIVIAIAKTGTGTVAATDNVLIHANGTFHLAFLPVLEPRTTYSIDLFVDGNGNGLCESPPLDSVWRKPFGPVTSDSTIAVTFDTDYDAAACASF